MGLYAFSEVEQSILDNHTTLITDAIDADSGQLGFAWRNADDNSYLFMPYDLWADAADLEEQPMAFVERKLEHEIRRLNDEIRKKARQVSDKCVPE